MIGFQRVAITRHERIVFILVQRQRDPRKNDLRLGLFPVAGGLQCFGQSQRASPGLRGLVAEEVQNLGGGMIARN